MIAPFSDASRHKRALREIVLGARAALPEQVRLSAAAAVAQRVSELPELADLRGVLAYHAMAEELDAMPVAELFRARGSRIALPRIDDPGVLDLHEFDDACELVPGPFGILEPAVSTPRFDIADIDLVIVPGLVFDEHGGRIGYGGGYYDRLLPRLHPGCWRLGVAFDEQVVPRVPTETHDERIDILVTPTKVLRHGR